MWTNRPLCFVLMPFGTKKDPASQIEINFDAVYEQAVRPGIEGAEMEAIRADEERTGGIIHKPMFERLLLSEFAVADLTTGNPNVYYELGVRHAVRPSTTLAIFADQQRIPFDLNYLRAVPYRLGESARFGPKEAGELASQLTRRLEQLRELGRKESAVDSPLFQLLGEYRPPDISHLKTDLFREQVSYSADVKNRLRRAREFGEIEAVAQIESELGDLDAAEAGVLVDLYLTWRALSKWDRMIGLYEKLPSALKRSILVREQYGFALNRAGRRAEALSALESVLSQQGPSSETLGLIGRIYKDQWMECRRQGQMRTAVGYLEKAIDAYVKGFESDWRDAYPGINAVTLLDIRGDDESLRRKIELLPVVRFAVTQRLKGSKPIYWDYATLLELAVLDNNEKESFKALSDSLASVREPWEPQTTANNLKLIREARLAHGLQQGWLDEVIETLELRCVSSAPGVLLPR
jgi:tetratricopeptide (TPR) repeat protein